MKTETEKTRTVEEEKTTQVSPEHETKDSEDPDPVARGEAREPRRGGSGREEGHDPNEAEAGGDSAPE